MTHKAKHRETVPGKFNEKNQKHKHTPGKMCTRREGRRARDSQALFPLSPSVLLVAVSFSSPLSTPEKLPSPPTKIWKEINAPLKSAPRQKLHRSSLAAADTPDPAPRRVCSLRSFSAFCCSFSPAGRGLCSSHRHQHRCCSPAPKR